MRFLRPREGSRHLCVGIGGLVFLPFRDLPGEIELDLPEGSLFSVPLVVLAPVLGVDPRPTSPIAALLFIPSLALAILVGLALDLLFGAIAVALEQPIWIIEYTRTAVATLLSGALLPLAYYPWGLGDVFGWLPFAAMAWAPLAIYTGTGSPLPLLASQLLWAAILWPVAQWLWRANREKLVGYGG